MNITFLTFALLIKYNYHLYISVSSVIHSYFAEPFITPRNSLKPNFSIEASSSYSFISQIFSSKIIPQGTWRMYMVRCTPAMWTFSFNCTTVWRLISICFGNFFYFLTSNFFFPLSHCSLRVDILLWIRDSSLCLNTVIGFLG